MPQIDVILRFTSRAAAKDDPAVRAYLRRNEADTDDDFAPDAIIPNVKVWRASQDVNGVHNYLAGFFVLVSLPRIVPALRDHDAVQVVINADTNAVLRKTVSNAVMQDLRFEPVFAGSNYPFGNWS